MCKLYSARVACMFAVIIIAATAFFATEPGIDVNVTAALSPGEDARALRRLRKKEASYCLRSGATHAHNLWSCKLL
jgi:hypothetical protein